jgi:uncharacterized protein
MNCCKTVTTVDVSALGIGTCHKIRFHEYGPENLRLQDINEATILSEEILQTDRAYLQASLHCSELPGLLVLNHLIKLLDVAGAESRIVKPIVIAPYANPIGLQQIVLGFHLGRFSLSTAVNFNRQWPALAEEAIKQLEGKLQHDNLEYNLRIIKQTFYQTIFRIWNADTVEKQLKLELFKRACLSSIVLDLHCDMEAVLHMYTHDLLWPQMQDLSLCLQTECNMICGDTGGFSFDETYSVFWEYIQKAFPDYHLPIACEAATIELRGQHDVSDSLALQDAQGLYRFLVNRGFIVDDQEMISISTKLLAQPSSSSTSSVWTVPFTGVDFIEATVPGIIVWKVDIGSVVEIGQILGEIVNIEDIDQPRIPIIARNTGFVYGRDLNRLAIPGEIMIYIAGNEVLEWRKGYLLTAK